MIPLSKGICRTFASPAALASSAATAHSATSVFFGSNGTARSNESAAFA